MCFTAEDLLGDRMPNSNKQGCAGNAAAAAAASAAGDYEAPDMQRNSMPMSVHLTSHNTFSSSGTVTT
jgi:hypothetical protein